MRAPSPTSRPSRFSNGSGQTAAETIVNAVAQRRARVVIGWEAKALDALARIVGPAYQRVIATAVSKLFPWAK